MLEAEETLLSESSRTKTQYCIFRSGERWYAVPAIEIREICTSSRLTSVPFSSGVLAGICNQLTEFIPIFFTRATSRFRGEPNPTTAIFTPYFRR